MHKITFECETITPMFLSGADGSTPELRPPSIKGALRFWWRAMNGHLASEENGGIKNLLKEDERLWGGVNGGGKSSISVRISNDSTEPYNTKNEIFSGGSGLKYFFYLIANNMTDRTLAIKEGSLFDLTLASKVKEDLAKAIASLWLLTNFGGLGARSRRGAGCIRVIGIKEGNNLLYDDNKAQIISLLANNTGKDISNNYKLCMKLLKKPNTPHGFSKWDDKYSTLTSNEIYISRRQFSSWKEALDNIGTVMKKVRLKDEDNAGRSIPFTLEELPMKAAFGLPIQIRNSPGFAGYYLDLLDNTRRASPLAVSILKTDNNKYNWILTYLDGDFAEKGNYAVVRNSNAKVHKRARSGEEFSWDLGRDDDFDDYYLVNLFIEKLDKTRVI